MSKAEENTDAPSAEPAVHDAPPSDDSSPTIAGPANAASDAGETPEPSAKEPTAKAAPAADVADMAYAAFEAPELSTEEAEHFAARFRASWEPSSPTAAVLAERARSVNPAAVAVPDADFDIGGAGAFPGAAQRRRGWLIATGAIFGFFALGALAFVMGTRGVTSPSSAVEQASKLAQSDEHAAAVAAPTPAPAAAPAPVPTIAPTAPAPDPEPPLGATPEQTAAELALAKPGEPSEPGEPGAAVEAVAPGENADTTASAGTNTTGEPAASPIQPAASARAAAEQAPAADEVEKPAADKPAADERAPAAGLVAGAELAENREPATVHVDIAASPAGAQLSIDGERVTNPFETRAPKGGRHRVLAEAPGHRSRDLTLEFNRDQHLDIRLERVAAKKPAPARARTTSSTTPAHRAQPAAAGSQPKGAGFVSESPY